MTYAPGRHIYLAAPFFNDRQRDLCSFIEGLESDTHPIYSPRHDGGVLNPKAPVEEIEAIFESNKTAIETADWVLAVIDDFDPGVVWEMGYAHARNPRVLGYSDVPGRGLNVMLAGSCPLGFVNGRDNLARLMDRFYIKFPRNTWSGEIQ